MTGAKRFLASVFHPVKQKGFPQSDEGSSYCWEEKTQYLGQGGQTNHFHPMQDICKEIALIPSLVTFLPDLRFLLNSNSVVGFEGFRI